LYRNKTRKHFKNVKRHYDNKLIPCLKDRSGDQRSPINGKLYGLCFTASVRPWSMTGEPLPKSPFGNTRLMLPVEYLLEEDTNLYFADFYCLYGDHHYVTLVVTGRFSEADKFCWRHLIKLDITDNPFL
ncbi:hypothetical protein HELRODRAFT_135179, partial [Helobdella robusta]|uniref:Phytanoyl-CoA hydroxylase-interacting protein-like C-terminal domain-containing protein n=1 Tax=Helobdella robusta TaxID=6412 RepID=T1EI71_HELRO